MYIARLFLVRVIKYGKCWLAFRSYRVDVEGHRKWPLWGAWEVWSLVMFNHIFHGLNWGRFPMGEYTPGISRTKSGGLTKWYRWLVRSVCYGCVCQFYVLFAILGAFLAMQKLLWYCQPSFGALAKIGRIGRNRADWPKYGGMAFSRGKWSYLPNHQMYGCSWHVYIQDLRVHS